jgi:hypothetical protein
MSATAKVVSTTTGCLVLLGMLVTGLLWAADKRYVTHDSLTLVLNEMRLGQINDVINELSTKKQYNEATQSELVRLEHYERRREEMLRKVK